jgi:hypothetical protein
MAVIWIAAGRFATAYDADAQAYITAVETADGQALETAVRDAINAFVVGCKADGIWNAIKASCIMAGARTLNGALRPLVGTAPTNFNFVAGDYSRKTGLVGNGTTKYLSSNRNSNADPDSNFHLSVRITSLPTTGHVAGHDAGSRNTLYGPTGPAADAAARASAGQILTGTVSAPTFYGTARSNGSSYAARIGGITNTYSVSVLAPSTFTPIFLFARNTASGANGYSNARLAFYSIGESLDLALLDARVTTLMNALAVAIP